MKISRPSIFSSGTNKIATNRKPHAGPFTVETLQNFEPVSPAALAAARKSDAEMGKFEDVIFEHLKSAGVKTGDKSENAVFHRIDRLADVDLHAEGFYKTAQGEAKAYLHIGTKFGTISKQAVNNATKACRRRGDADWLIILGFSFESDIESKSVTTSQGQFQVTKVRMHARRPVAGRPAQERQESRQLCHHRRA